MKFVDWVMLILFVIAVGIAVYFLLQGDDR